MKKIILPICFLVTGLFIFSQYATAVETGAGCGRGGCGRGGCGQKLQRQQPLDAETQKKYDKFMLETADLRKELAEKQAKFETLMASENPDASKIALLTQEFYQLRDFLTEKAVQAGLVEKSQGRGGCGGQAGVACDRPEKGEKVEKIN